MDAEKSEAGLPINRRGALAALAVGGAATLLGSRARAAVEAKPNASASAVGKHELVPLPFDPKKLKGLSERLLVSHHDNNYGGAVKNLNKVEEELA